MSSNDQNSTKVSFFSRIFGKLAKPSSHFPMLASSLLKQDTVPFTQFNQLPVELQIKIWEYFVQLPPAKNEHKRHTRLYMSGYERQPDGLYIQTRFQWTPCVDVAAALRSCHLSRKLAITYCLSLMPEGNIECPYDEKDHLSEFGHKLPQFHDASTAPSVRSYGDLAIWEGKQPFDVSAMPCITPQTVLGTVRFLIVGEEYLDQNRLRDADVECSCNH